MKGMPANLWLRLGRILVGAYAVVILMISAAGIVLFPAYAREHAEEWNPTVWTVAQVRAGLGQLGWPVTAPAYVELGRYVLMMGVGLPVGLLLLRRRPASWFTLYLAFIFISMGLGEVFINPVRAYLPGISSWGKFLGPSSWQFFFIALYFFPNGQAIPRWTRWVALVWLGLIFYAAIFGEIKVLNGTGIFFALPIGGTFSQIYRYFWRSNPIERQQTKWIFASIALMLAFIALIASWAFNPPSGPDYGASLVIALANLFLFAMMFALFPLAVAVAVFRYRLWDIDVVIRRTLQYGLLTALLGLVYLGGVTLLQQVFTSVTGAQSPLALVISTLLIVFLFTPVRRRLQAFIDRRFFRSQYDAALTLEEFRDATRREVELERMTTLLVGVVERTVQPEGISIWLKK